jgi:hypothetical protein
VSGRKRSHRDKILIFSKVDHGLLSWRMDGPYSKETALILGCQIDGYTFGLIFFCPKTIE